MAFPANTNMLADALARLRVSAARLKAYAASAKATLAAGNVSGNQIIDAMVQFQTAVQEWDAVAATPGLADYAKAQYNDANLDIVAEYNAMHASAASVVSWIQTNFPKDASGYILKDKFDATTGLAVVSFTPAQTAGLQTALGNFIATVT